MAGPKTEGERIRGLWKQVQCLSKKINEEGAGGVKEITDLNFENGKLTLSYKDAQGIKKVETLIEGSGELQIKYNVENYTELLTVESPTLYDFAYVRESQGTTWLPGSLGGSYYGSGLYMWDGDSWIEDDTEVFQQLDQILETLQNLQNNKVSKEDLPKYVSVQAGITRENQTTVALANQQARVYEEYLSLEYPCTVTDNYKISINFKYSSNNARNNVLFRLSLTDGTTTLYDEISFETKDTGGNGVIVDVLQGGVIVGQVTTSTDIILNQYFPVDVILEKDKTYKVALEFGHDEANSATTIYSSTIRLQQKTQNP